jgi:CRP/FNR family transcriptional regulator
MTENLQIELARLGFLDEALLAEQRTLLDSVSVHTYKPGETIYSNEGESKLLFVIREGMVKLLTYLPNGRTRIVRMHKRGSMIGLDGLINQSHEHTAMAIDEVSVFQIPHTELQRWRDEETRLYSHLLEKWHEYLGYADTWITDFSTGNVKGRVARLIRFLSKFESETGPQIVELLTTEEMSEILGVTPESVSRVVAEFKRDGLLEGIENNTESLFSCDLSRIEQVCRL